MASRDYHSDIASEINKLRRDRGSNVSYLLRKYREEKPNPYRGESTRPSHQKPKNW